MKTNRIHLDLGGGTLLQVANRMPTQMMSYIIDTPEGGVIVIDGGDYNEPDGKNLYSLLTERGKKVDLWIITHAHSDHFGAMLYLMEHNSFDVEIGKLCFNLPAFDWLASIEKSDTELCARLMEHVQRLGIHTVTVQPGDIFRCGSVSVEIISVPETYRSYPSVNSTSIIFKVHFPKRDVLFMGDFDVHGQADFLARHDASVLRCDILQMPHHGQNGIDRSFYERIMPKICLYTAPKWLWENNKYKCDDPETAGTGPFTIMETRRWMEELGAEASYTLADGDLLFE